MKSVEWKTYRTRFLVKAKQLNSSLSFTDHLGRQHCGRKGDYLVESCDGVLSIAPRQIFEDIYVPICTTESSELHREEISDTPVNRLGFEPLQIGKIDVNFRDDAPQARSLPKRLPRIRKSPQPVRVSTFAVPLRTEF